MPSDTIERDTGLTPHQQRERATVARGWAWRVLWTDKISACGVRLALRAVEAAERETQDQKEVKR